jgi:hypothetical protein
MVIGIELIKWMAMKKRIEIQKKYRCNCMCSYNCNIYGYIT